MTKTQTNSIQTNGSNLTFKGSGAATYGTMFLSTGNFLLQNEGTFTDSGFRLDVNGTARIQNQLTTTGSITAASAIARGVYMNQTLVAAANNDVLVGLDINPSFTNGAFTGVTNTALRVTGNATISGNVGIGTLSPFTDLHISKSYSGAQTEFRIQNINTSGFGTRFSLYSDSSNANERNWAFIQSAFSYGDFSFSQSNAQGGNPYTAGTIRFYIAQNGNVAIGTTTNAGYRLDVVGADSRFNGIRAGLGSGQVAGNTVFGDGALGSNSTGTGLTAFGYRALRVSTASFNTALGYTTLLNNSTGVSNTGIGSESLNLNTIGSSNTAIGRNSLFSNTEGGENVAIGYNTMLYNIIGNSNVGIGKSALQANTASNNTAVGSGAAQTNTSGTGITAVGYQALTASTGNNNTAIGYQSLSAHTTGTNNTALGHLTASGNFSGCLILGKDATATANNQFVIGSASYNAGAVATASVTQTKTWDVIINGVAQKILLA